LSRKTSETRFLKLQRCTGYGRVINSDVGLPVRLSVRPPVCFHTGIISTWTKLASRLLHRLSVRRLYSVEQDRSNGIWPYDSSICCFCRLAKI